MAADKHRARLEEGAAHMQRDIQEADKWPTLTQENNVKVVYKSGSPDRFIAQLTVNASAERVLEACYNFESRLKWDGNINKHSKLLESLSDDISITYQQVDGRMGVSARDFVNARLKKVLPDGTIIVVHNCVDHPYDGPNKPVRGKHHDTGYIIQPVNESSCRVWWIIQTDIGGWVGFVNVRSITGQQMVQLLNNLKKYAEQA